MHSFFITAGSLLAIAAQGFAESLPTVDLDYALYRASSFNVGWTPLTDFSAITFTNPIADVFSSRLLVITLPSRISDMLRHQ
jgi:hypothetical protein